MRVKPTFHAWHLMSEGHPCRLNTCEAVLSETPIRNFPLPHIRVAGNTNGDLRSQSSEIRVLRSVTHLPWPPLVGPSVNLTQAWP